MAISRDEILIAGARIFNEKGYEAASVQDIANACGISKPSLYSLFSSKEDLFVNVFANLQDSFKNGILMLEESTLNERELLMRSSALIISLFSSNYLIMISSDAPNTPYVMKRKREFGAWVLARFNQQIVSVYGKGILPYSWDLSFIRRAIERELSRKMAESMLGDTPIDQIASYVIFVLDAVREKILAEQRPPLIASETAAALNTAEIGEDVDATIACDALFDSIEKTLAITHCEQRAEDIRSMIGFFREELRSEEPRLFLLRAILDSLRTEHELSSITRQLQLVLATIRAGNEAC